MKTLAVILLVSLKMCGSNVSENKDSIVSTLPVMVQNSVLSLYPEAENLLWEKNGKGNFELEFRSQGQNVKLIVDQEGDLIRNEVHIKETDLPNIILDNLKRRGMIRIARAVKIKKEEEESYFVIALTATERLKLTYDKTGKLISESSILRNKKQFEKTPLPENAISQYDKKWELPFILTEISGFTFIDNSTIACIQDELGIVYLYDLDKSLIIREIPFSQPGDFEGIAKVGNDLWALRSDGLLCQIKDYKDTRPIVNEYFISLNHPQNFEGLCYDSQHHTLLIVPREFDTEDHTRKGIYSFDLKRKEFSKDPVYSLDLNHSLFSNLPKKGKAAVLMPSEISIHPVTSKIYITDARNAQILILTRQGELEKLIRLNRDVFVKTEGIFFNQRGEVYLSNEGKKQNANVLFVKNGID